MNDVFVRVRRKLVKWLFFTVVVTFLSLVAGILVPWLHGIDVAEIDLTTGGEPFVVGLAIAASGVGELVFDRKNDGRASLSQGIAIGIAIIVICLAAICYGATKIVEGSGKTSATLGAFGALSTPRVSSIAVWIVGAAIFSSLSCVIISELGD